MPARTAVTAAAAVLTGGVAAAVLAGCYVDAGSLRHHTNHYTVSGQVRVLVVNAHVGGVDITGGSAGAVAVTEHTSYRHTAPATTHRVAGGTLTLDSSCPALETCSVGYDITVPRPVTVRVSANVGTIHLRNLSGQVTAHTNAGAIGLSGLSGPVEATGHAGSVTGRDISSRHAILRTSAGEISVAFAAPPTAVTATTAVGPVTLRLPGNVAYAVHASASVGSTQVGVTRSRASPHVITASTRTGSVTVEPAP